MEMALFLFGCLFWHGVILAVGWWLGAAKPWRLARDYGEFRQWRQSQRGYPPKYEEEYVG